MSETSQPLILSQMTNRLKELFGELIDLSDLQGQAQTLIESAFNTRAYMALCLMDEIEITAEQAAASITDGYKDDGIDAVYIDEKQKIIYLGQSKWKSNTNKGIPLPEFNRFRDGVKNIIDLQWGDHNADLHRFSAGIEAQLKDIDAEVRLLFVHNSDQ